MEENDPGSVGNWEKIDLERERLRRKRVEFDEKTQWWQNAREEVKEELGEEKRSELEEKFFKELEELEEEEKKIEEVYREAEKLEHEERMRWWNELSDQEKSELEKKMYDPSQRTLGERGNLKDDKKAFDAAKKSPARRLTADDRKRISEVFLAIDNLNDESIKAPGIDDGHSEHTNYLKWHSIYWKQYMVGAFERGDKETLYHMIVRILKEYEEEYRGVTESHHFATGQKNLVSEKAAKSASELLLKLEELRLNWQDTF